MPTRSAVSASASSRTGDGAVRRRPPASSAASTPRSTAHRRTGGSVRAGKIDAATHVLEARRMADGQFRSGRPTLKEHGERSNSWGQVMLARKPGEFDGLLRDPANGRRASGGTERRMVPSKRQRAAIRGMAAEARPKRFRPATSRARLRRRATRQAPSTAGRRDAERQFRNEKPDRRSRGPGSPTAQCAPQIVRALPRTPPARLVGHPADAIRNAGLRGIGGSIARTSPEERLDHGPLIDDKSPWNVTACPQSIIGGPSRADGSVSPAADFRALANASCVSGAPKPRAGKRARCRRRRAGASSGVAAPRRRP